MVKKLLQLYRARKSRRGFTLVELMIVITVMAILVTIGVVSFTRVQAQSRDTKRKADLRAIQTALQASFTETTAYPTEATGNTITSTELSASYIPSIPTDPTGAAYWYDANATNNGYSLCAALETGQPSSGTACSGTEALNWLVSTANAGGTAICVDDRATDCAAQ